MSPSFLIPRCFSGLKKWPDLLSVSGKQRCNIDPAQTAWDLEKRTGGVTSILRKAFKSCILSFHPSLGAQSAHLMMSMCPFLAARCSGLVPLGSVESPGLASNRAAHMLLLSSSWTTCRANRWPYTHTEANYWQKNRKKDIKIIWHYQKKNKKTACDSPQLGQIHKPSPMESSQHCPLCRGLTGAAEASQTVDR